MITLSPDENVVWRRLRELAAERRTISYRDLAIELQPHLDARVDFRAPFNPLYPMLGHVSTYEVTRLRPMLSAVVIPVGSNVAGEGFFKLARQLGFEVRDERVFYEQQRDAVFAFWSTIDPIEVVDRATTVVIDRLDEVLKLLRRRAAS